MFLYVVVTASRAEAEEEKKVRFLASVAGYVKMAHCFLSARHADS